MSTGDAAAPAPLTISLAGQVSVSDLGPLGSLALAYLVTERHRPVTRDELAEVLWGDELPATWEPSLRNLISRLRRRLECAGLPADAVAGARGTYRLRLPAGTVVDVEAAADNVKAAREALRRGDVASAHRLAERAAEVAARPFLAGLGGLWVEQRQAALDDVRLEALEVLSEAASARGDHATALRAAEAAITMQPLRESSHLRAIAAHGRAGNRAEALRAYERCRRTLADELGVSPSELTEAAYLALLAGGDEASSTGAPPTNLRADLSSFVGRSEELDIVEKMLGTARLLTLVGPGGVGKTRLAARVASTLISRYRHGVWLVELAALSDPELLSQHVLSTVGLAQEGDSTPAESLRRHLASRELLVVLDNCEHLLAACAGLVRDLLGAAPALTVLATSREPLSVAGEALWPVPPLSVPEADDPAPDRLWESEAVRLFVERASEADPAFALSDATARAVGDICRRLDGLPLAVELAAARTRSLSVHEIAARLGDRFRLLVGRDATAPDRHHTLRAAVDWSHDALAEWEQVLFRRVSVFAGGFTLAAAEAVAGGDALDGLAALVDKSLVIADRSGPITRYRLLETLRQYGAERLAVSGEEQVIRRRHLAWVRSLAEAAEPELEGDQQADWLQFLDGEQDNVRAALDWAVTHPGGEDGLRTAAALWRYWQVRARFGEGWRFLNHLLDSSGDVPPPVRAKALASAAIIALTSSEAPLSEAESKRPRELFEESLAMWRAIGDRRAAASALHGLGGIFFRQWDLERARACFEETLAIGRDMGEKRLVAASLTNLAAVAQRARRERDRKPPDLDAKALYEESLPLWRELGDHFAVARALSDLAAIAMMDDQPTLARALLTEGIAIRRQIDDRLGLVQAIAQLGWVAERDADYAGARVLFEESLALRRELDDPFLLARGLIELGDVAWREGDYAGAKRLFEEAAAVGRTLDLGWPLYNALNGLAALALVRGEVGDARRIAMEAAGVADSSHDLSTDAPWSSALLAAVAVAEGRGDEAAGLCRKALSSDRAKRWPSEIAFVALDVLSVVAAQAGDLERAATWIGAADKARGPIAFAPFRARPEYQEACAATRQGLGDDGFDAARRKGAALSPEEILHH